MVRQWPLAVSLILCACGATAGDSSSNEETAVCDPGDRTVQRRGTDCRCCHAELGIAGSAIGAATVFVVDQRGVEARMSPNAVGNFFRKYQPEPPLRVWLVREDGTVRAMKSDAPHGSCNACHGATAPRLD